MGYLFRTMSFSRSPLLLCSFFFCFNRDFLTYAFTLIYGLMVNSAFFDTSNAVSICTEIQIPMQLSPFKQCRNRYLQAHKIFTTVNAEFSELKQILYKCKILPEPTWTNSYHSYVIQNSWLVFLVVLHLSLILL